MKRRLFITGAVAATLGRLSAARAQGRMFRIGTMNGIPATDPRAAARMAAFAEDLETLGWKLGRDVAIEPRWFGGDLVLMRRYARELVELSPDVIVSVSDPALAEFRRLTQTLPIVFLVVADPVANGFVRSLARPGGNLTGISNAEPALAGKWIELLREIAPHLRGVVLLVHPDSVSAASFAPALRAAAASLDLPVNQADIRAAADVDAAIGTASAARDCGLIVVPSAVTSSLGAQIASRAAERRIPAIYPFTQHVAQGGLISYGIDITAVWRQAPWYVDRILRGTSPGDLPVQQPSRFELAINLAAARTIGLSIPGHLISRADKVIE
jgi:putative ABC transport system substrate-binding protein